MNKRWSEALRRVRYAQAEMTPGLNRRQARRAALDARYGPCVGDVEGVACPVHGFHETSDPEPATTRDEHLANVVPIVLMAVVIVVSAILGASAWVGIPLAVLTGPVLHEVWIRVLRRERP